MLPENDARALFFVFYVINLKVTVPGFLSVKNA
jgi:hypothetical protein